MAAIEPSSSVLRAGASIDAPALAAQLSVLVRTGVTSVVCEVDTLVADAAAVDGLARLRLAARRLGCELRVRRASAELRQLLAFVGLAEVVLGVEVRREPEDREQRVGVEEERELDDPGS
jgi:STAS domain